MRRAKRKYALIKFVESNENPDGIWHSRYYKRNKNGDLELAEKPKSFKFITRGSTRLEIYNHQHNYFPEHKGRGYKVISYPYGSEYEIFEK